jgi:hypothetical protein
MLAADTCCVFLQKFTPIFFSKDDLDAALKDAHSTRKSIQAAEYTAEAAKHRAEFKSATKEVLSVELLSTEASRVTHAWHGTHNLQALCKGLCKAASLTCNGCSLLWPKMRRRGRVPEARQRLHRPVNPKPWSLHTRSTRPQCPRSVPRQQPGRPELPASRHTCTCL